MKQKHIQVAFSKTQFLKSSLSPKIFSFYIFGEKYLTSGVLKNTVFEEGSCAYLFYFFYF